MKYDKPVFVTGYPTKVKAFYMQPDPDRPEIVNALTCWRLRATVRSLAAVREFTTWISWRRGCASIISLRKLRLVP